MLHAGQISVTHVSNLPTEIASILYACDQEIFTGWESSKVSLSLLCRRWDMSKMFISVVEIICSSNM